MYEYVSVYGIDAAAQMHDTSHFTCVFLAQFTVHSVWCAVQMSDWSVSIGRTLRSSHVHTCITCMNIVCSGTQHSKDSQSLYYILNFRHLHIQDYLWMAFRRLAGASRATLATLLLISRMEWEFKVCGSGTGLVACSDPDVARLQNWAFAFCQLKWARRLCSLFKPIWQ